MDASGAPRRTAVKPVYWAAAFAIAAALLYFSLRGIAWAKVWASLRGAKPWAVALALASISFAMFLRSLRWRTLLTAEGPVSIPLAFWATAAGYFGNNVLPARAGEVVRTLMISRRAGLNATFVLTTALSERVSDAVALIGIAAVSLLLLPVRPGWLAGAARPFAILGIAGVLGIALLPRFEGLYRRLLRALPIPARFRGALEGILGQALQGVRSFHDAGRLARFLGLTAAIWCLDAFTAMACARALSVPLALPVAFLLLAGIGLGSALPSTPGYIGIYQFVAVSVLTPFGIGRDDALACILLFQALIYVVVLAWGSIGIARQRSGRG